MIRFHDATQKPDKREPFDSRDARSIDDDFLDDGDLTMALDVAVTQGMGLDSPLSPRELGELQPALHRCPSSRVHT